MSKSFNQSRKDYATRFKETIHDLLDDHYTGTVVNVERAGNGEYDGELDALQLLDYAGIDWLVDSPNGLVPVGERVKRNGETDFSLRVDNGTRHPSEREKIPTAIQTGAIHPQDYLVVATEDESIELAYLLDVPKAIAKIEAGEINTTRASFDDGTVSEFYTYADLCLHDCVTEVLV